MAPLSASSSPRKTLNTMKANTKKDCVRSPASNPSGFYVSTRLAVLLLIGTSVLLFNNIQSLLVDTRLNSVVSFSTATSATARTTSINSVNHLRSTQTRDDDDTTCTLYLAESAIPQSGMGIFTAVGLHPGDPIGHPDICVYVSDIEAPVPAWMQLRTHTFGKNFFNQHEGRMSRAACEGLATNVNTMPDHMINTQLVSPYLATHAGLHRSSHPGAGAITHHYGMHGQSLDVVTAGSELTIDYGDWEFDPNKVYTKPERPVDWLRRYGWCIDNIDIKPATDPSMGRGAFARRALLAGSVVAPAPLQVLPYRAVFTTTRPFTATTGTGTGTGTGTNNNAEEEEQLFVNYCLQPKHSSMLLFPYGQGVNLINHASSRTSSSNPAQEPNVELRWATHDNGMHHGSWLDLSLEEFWKVAKPGGLILEVVTLRDVGAGEELYLDYGPDFEAAWNRHVAQWKPPSSSSDYVYPAEMDETAPLRTVDEQRANPYPDNLMMMCSTPDHSRREKTGKNITWYDHPHYTWWQTMTSCHVLDREPGPHGDEMYTVQLTWLRHGGDPAAIAFDPRQPRDTMYIDHKVPRRAIRFVEKPYADDEHLPGAFRHPIALPDELVPDAWRTEL